MTVARDFDVDAALRIITKLAASLPAFTTDDVWAQLDATHDGRAIANAMIRAEREGHIRKSRIGTFVRGRQAHRRWLAVWLPATGGATDSDALAYARTHFDA